MNLLDLPGDMLVEITARVAGGAEGRCVWLSCCKTLWALRGPVSQIPYDWMHFACDAPTHSLSLVQWLWPTLGKKNVCHRLAHDGHLAALQWVRARGAPWDHDTCTYAGKEGHLAVLQWARAQDPPCPWNKDMSYWIACMGHLDVLQWARAQDPPCPWDSYVIYHAQKSSHWRLAEWAFDNGCPLAVENT